MPVVTRALVPVVVAMSALVALVPVHHASAAAPAAPSKGYTSWSVHSQEGSGIGDTPNPRFTEPEATFDIHFYGDWVHMTVGDGRYTWDAGFGTRNDQPVTAGMYRGASRIGDTNPSIDVSGDEHGCNMSTGWFNISELTRVDDQITHFSVTFVQRCLDGPPTDGPAVMGSIAWHATRPAAPVPTGYRMNPTLSLAVAAKTPVIDGARTRITGRLARGASSTSVPNKEIVVYARPHGSTARWARVGSGATIHNDFYAVPVTVSQATDYLAKFTGNRDFNPATSNIGTVRARWQVHLHGGFRARHGKARLRASVLHGHRGQVVVLRRLEHNQWRNVARGHLTAHGAASFIVSRPAEGFTTYLAFAPASHRHLAAVSVEDAFVEAAHR